MNKLVARAWARLQVEAVARARRLQPQVARLARAILQAGPEREPANPLAHDGLGGPPLPRLENPADEAGSEGRREIEAFLLMRELVEASPERPAVSVIVPAFNQDSQVYRCIRTLLMSGARVPFEVIVVDDGSSDATPQLLKAIGRRVRSIRHETPQGLSAACNRGAHAARGQHLVFLGAHLEAAPGWLDALLKSFEDFDHLGAVGSRLAGPGGRLQSAGGAVFRNGRVAPLGVGLGLETPLHGYAREVDACSAACIATRRDLFEQVGGFDSRYVGPGYAGADLCFRLRALGLRVLYQPGSKLLCREHPAEPTHLEALDASRFVAQWSDSLSAQPVEGHGEPAFDRAMGPHVLMVDCRIPHVDEDSGSVRAFAMARLLVKAGCRVSFMLRDGQSWDRHCAALGAVGVRTLSEREAFEQLRAARIALVVVSRYDVAELFFDRIRSDAPSVPVVFDTVDLHFVRLGRAATLLDKPLLRAESARARALEVRFAKASALTLVVTDADRETLLAEHGGLRVGVVPNIHVPVDEIPRLEGRTVLLFVGGFGHAPNADAMIYFVNEVLPRVRELVEEVELEIVGSNAPEEVLALHGEGVRVVGYVSDLTPVYRRARVVVAPLRYGAGMKGKIGEALAHGVPVVTTAVGAEGMGLEDGRSALIADSTQAFAEAVARLWRDEVLWSQLSGRGRELIESRYSPSAVSALIEPIVQLARGSDQSSEAERPNTRPGSRRVGS